MQEYSREIIEKNFNNIQNTYIIKQFGDSQNAEYVLTTPKMFNIIALNQMYQNKNVHYQKST